jgi:hypothetical protein
MLWCLIKVEGKSNLMLANNGHAGETIAFGQVKVQNKTLDWNGIV